MVEPLLQIAQWETITAKKHNTTLNVDTSSAKLLECQNTVATTCIQGSKNDTPWCPCLGFSRERCHHRPLISEIFCLQITSNQIPMIVYFFAQLMADTTTSRPCQRFWPPKVWNCIFCELTMKAYFLDIDEVAHSDRILSYRVRGVVPSSLSWNSDTQHFEQDVHKSRHKAYVLSLAQIRK